MNENVVAAAVGSRDVVIIREGINSYNPALLKRYIPERPYPQARPCPFRLLEERCQSWVGDEKANQCWNCHQAGQDGVAQLELEAYYSRITEEFVLHALDVAKRVLDRVTPEFKPTNAFIVSKIACLEAKNFLENPFPKQRAGTELFVAFKMVQEAISCTLLPTEARWLATSIRSLAGQDKRLIEKAEEALKEFGADSLEAWQSATRRGWLYPRFIEPQRLREGFQIELEAFKQR